jgi:hypothetical protein
MANSIAQGQLGYGRHRKRSGGVPGKMQTLAKLRGKFKGKNANIE